MKSILGALCILSLGLAGPPYFQSDSEPVYRPSDGVSMPVVLKQVAASYTGDALRARITGAVKLQCVVRIDGTVADVRVTGPLEPSLDEQAIRALQQWRFKPGMKDGRPVHVLVDVEMHFRLRNNPQRDEGVPYKLGTFAEGERVFLGLVLNDTVVVDLTQADPSIPSDMKLLVQRFDTLHTRLASIATAAAARRPSHAYDVKSLRTLPPILPQNILNAAVNYTEHAQEMAGRSTNTVASPATPPPAEGIPGIWERKPGDTRHNPYVFPKPVSAVIGNGEPIRLPRGRDRIDWECELSVVIGQTADHVPVERAKDYIFGYTLQNDVSDRGGRADGRHGSDWFIAKGHDTFAPLGPYLVPKVFVPDPHKLAITFTLSGKLMQDSTTARMTHSVYELVSYVSNIVTLKPGDVISTGSPAGVGAARGVFMKPGDLSVCTIAQIGTLTNPVVGPATPGGADGAR